MDRHEAFLKAYAVKEAADKARHEAFQAVFAGGYVDRGELDRLTRESVAAHAAWIAATGPVSGSS